MLLPLLALIPLTTAFSMNLADPPPPLTAAEKSLITQTNQFRAQQNQPALKGNDKLHLAARTHAQTMIKTGDFSHHAGGTQPAQRVSKARYEWNFVAENIAWRTIDSTVSAEQLAGAVLDQWINSPGHRQNLTSSQAIECGVSILDDPQSGRTYAVMVYARPQ